MTSGFWELQKSEFYFIYLFNVFFKNYLLSYLILLNLLDFTAACTASFPVFEDYEFNSLVRSSCVHLIQRPEVMRILRTRICGCSCVVFYFFLCKRCRYLGVCVIISYFLQEKLYVLCWVIFAGSSYCGTVSQAPTVMMYFYFL